MAANLAPVLRYIRRLAAPACPHPESDAALLDRFARRHDESAFTALVSRHGPMVLGVCHRVLGDAHDAEDAFQATFLILARKAGSLSRPEALPAWLYGTAYRVARKARGRLARHQAQGLPEGEADLPDPHPDPLAQVTARELLRALEEEVQRLPEAYRLPIVLCCLEGLSREEAARRLGWAPGAVKGRLERGRKRLHEQLVRRGLTLSAALAVVELSRAAAPAQLPTALATAAVKAAFAAGVGHVSARVTALAEGGLRGVATGKMKLALLLLVGIGAAAVGAAMHPAREQKQLASEQQPGAAGSASGSAGPTMGSAGRASPACRDYYGDPLPPGALARMGSVQLRHKGGARLAFTADGKALVSADWGAVLEFWDVTAGRLARRTPIRLLPKLQESQPGGSVAGLSPDGKRLAVFWGESVNIYDTATGAELHRLPAGGTGHPYAEFSRDGKLLVTLLGRGGRYVFRLWDLPAGKERLALPEASYINSFALTRDGRLLGRSEGAVGNQSLSVWDTATGRELGRVQGPSGNVTFSPDGKTLACGDRYGTVTLWDAATLKPQATLKPSVASWTSSGLAYSPDGTLLAVATDKDVVLWDMASRTERRRLDDRDVRSLAFAPSSRALACAGGAEIRLWDPTTGEELHRRPGHDHLVWSVAVSPDGKVLASASYNDPVVRLWDAVTGKPLAPLLRHRDCVRSCAFSADGKVLLSGSGLDGTLCLRPATTGEEIRRFVIKDVSGSPQRHEVLVCYLSPDGRRLAAVSTTWDKQLNHNRNQLSVWNAHTGELLARRPFPGGLQALDSCFTPGGEGVTVDGTDYLTVEDLMTGRELSVVPGDLGRPVAFSPDGALVAAGIHKTLGQRHGGYQPQGVRVAEVLTGQEVLHVGGWVEYAAFSPDGRVLATADPEALRLWDAFTGTKLFERPWPGGLAHGPVQTPISSLAFFPTRRALATGMADGTILVWDLASAKWPADGPVRDLGPKQLEGLWEDLGGDARRACPAVHVLTSAPAQAVAFLRNHLRPVAAADPERIEKWIHDLDSDQFAVREAASRELSRLGEQAEPALRQALKGKSSDEVRRRAQSLLDGLRAVPPAPALRTLRAIRLLARVGTPEARQVLDQVASGAPAARETREAREALARLPHKHTLSR